MLAQDEARLKADVLDMLATLIFAGQAGEAFNVLNQMYTENWDTVTEDSVEGIIQGFRMCKDESRIKTYIIANIRMLWAMSLMRRGDTYQAMRYIEEAELMYVTCASR